MAKVRVKHVDAFTVTPHTGNPAAVVMEGENLSDHQMQCIAREMNLSETAFILPPTKKDADVRIRWFTPTTEVPICGHATIASFHSLAEEGRLGMEKTGKYHFQVETASGILPLDVTKNGNFISTMFGLKLPTFQRVVQFKVDLVRILDLRPTEFDMRMPLLRDEYLFAPIKRLHTLINLKPNFLMMANYLNLKKLGGLCLYTTETIERESVVHSRFFAPNCGINEDPVTGSSHGPLAVLLYESKKLDITEGRCVFQGEQGDAIGRKGRVTIELQVEKNKPVSVMVGGSAVTLFEGEMLLQ